MFTANYTVFDTVMSGVLQALKDVKRAKITRRHFSPRYYYSILFILCTFLNSPGIFGNRSGVFENRSGIARDLSHRNVADTLVKYTSNS